MLLVIKRDGTRVPFEKEKIVNAILKSFKAVDDEISEYAITKANNIADYIEKYDFKSNTASVEQIQDLVEHGLMATKRKDVARAYISYRNERTREREKNSTIRKIVKEKISAKNVKNQNANVDEKSFGGRMGEANSAVMRQLALDEYMSETTRENHINNRVYQHDLDHWVVGDHNCLSLPLDDALAKGFNTRQTDVRPANSVNTAFQLVAVLFQLQSLNQFGGVSSTHLDWTMVPYVRKSFMKHYIITYLKSTDEFFTLDLFNMSNDELDEWVSKNKQKYLNELNLKEEDFYFDNKDNLDEKLYKCAVFDTKREIYQAAEGLYHNLNTLQSRSGNQLPFTSINYGTCTLPEGRMVCHALLDALLKGVGKLHRTSVFPCGIFQYMKGVNARPGTPNYDLKRKALMCTAKRLYPNYANVDWSGNAGYDINDPRTYFSTINKTVA